MSDFLKGLARAGTADLVGGPVDLMEVLANLGIAGGGYAAHKLGLIDKPPELLSGSLGTSDWFAKNTPLQDTGTGDYTKGRVTGALAPLAWGMAGKLAPKIEHGKLNSILVPEEWIGKYGIKDQDQAGRPLGRLAGDEPGKNYVALNRELTPEQTLARMKQAGTADLGYFAPEVRGTPLEAVRTSLRPMEPDLGGTADFHQNLININSQPQGRMITPLQATGFKHHEATHFADAKAGSPAFGSWEGAVNPADAKYQQGLEHLEKFAPEFARDMRLLLTRSVGDRYKGDAGEIRARVAGSSAPMLSPSSAALGELHKSERSGLVPNFRAEGVGGKFVLPVDALQSGRLTIARGDGGRPILLLPDGRPLGFLDNDHEVGSIVKGMADDPDALRRFKSRLGDRMGQRIGDIQTQIATRDWAYSPGAQLLSSKTGNTLTIENKHVNKKGESQYWVTIADPKTGETSKSMYTESALLADPNIRPLTQQPADLDSVQKLLRGLAGK